MRALIIGGTGYIGTRLARALRSRGWNVRLFGIAGADADFIRGDRHDANALRGLANREWDAVFDLIAYTPTETHDVLDALRGHAGRFVHLSTVAVCERLLGTPATEEMTVRWARGGRGYGPEKADCERVLEEQDDVPWTVIRSAPIVGTNDPVSRENYFLKRILARRPIVVPAPLDGITTFVFIDDLVDALVRAATESKAIGRAIHVAQPDAPSIGEHIAEIARIAVVEPLIVEKPVTTLVEQGFHIYGFPYAAAPRRRLDVNRASRDLGWTATPYPAVMEQIVESLLQKREQPSWPGRGTTQSRMAGTHEWLHADLERLRAASIEPSWLRDDSAALDALRGIDGSGCTVLTPEQWRAVAAVPPVDGAQTRGAIVAPPELLQRIRGAAPVTIPIDGAWRLQAVLEPSADRETAWLYLQQPPATQDYRFDNGVLRIRFTPFAELRTDAVSEDERVIAEVRDDRDRRALTQWIRRRRSGAPMQIGSIASHARIYLAAPHRLSHTFDVVRLLRTFDTSLPDAITLRLLAGPRYPLVMFEAERRMFAADLAARRLFEL